MFAKANPWGALHIGQSLPQLCGHQPGEDWQANFTHIPPILPHRKLHYRLTFVDTFTGWIETFLVSRETADMVAQVSQTSMDKTSHDTCLLTHTPGTDA